MEKIDKVIKAFKTLNEMMVANAAGQSGAYTSSGDENTKAGFDPIMGKFMKRKKVDFRKVPQTYKTWVKNLNNKY